MIKTGDLVRINPNIDEYHAERGETLGIVINICKSSMPPASSKDTKLVEIYWTDGECEKLYTDELQPLNV